MRLRTLLAALTTRALPSIVFGQGIRDRMSLFGVNFGIFSPEPTPSSFQLPVGVPGAPAP
jgi:hypothetical protein